nr:MAG TPA: hypothetical protein [Caudoviricetes sp.]
MTNKALICLLFYNIRHSKICKFFTFTNFIYIFTLFYIYLYFLFIS